MTYPIIGRHRALVPPSNGFGTRRITYGYLLGRVSRPLADSNRKELGPPLGSPVNSSMEVSCSSLIEDSMTRSPFHLAERRRRGCINQKSRHPSISLLLRAKAQGLPSQITQKVPTD
jgi:hypothetical protein